MQVRHIEQHQLVLDKVEKLDPEMLPAVAQEKPWEEIVECLAVLAAIHMNPCQAAAKREEDERKQQPADKDDDTDAE